MDPSSNSILLKEIIKELIGSVKPQDFLTYFRKMTISKLENNGVVFGVESGFMRDNLRHKFYDVIKDSTNRIVPETEYVDFVIDREIDTPSNNQVIDCVKEYKELTSKKKKEDKKESINDGVIKKIINQRYRFDNFVVGASNQLPYAACEAVSRKPGKTYNPLFIYGDVGLGKTHLLQATGNSIKDKYKDSNVVYTTADRFVNDYVSSVKAKNVDKLREKYRAIDVLIVDDIQFLAGKKQTQEELYNIFNLMYESSKQIILSSDRPPKELTELEARLRSRFEWGITVDIGSPDYETRLAILQEKAREREFIIPQEVAEFIAENTSENIREIEGLLNQIIAEYELHNTPPTLENVARRMNKLSITEHFISNVSAKRKKNKISYEDLIEYVSSHFGVDKKEVMGDDRRKENMIPRQVSMYLLKTRMNYTYERIGNIFSGRNHSAVLYSCKKLEQILKKNQDLHYELNIIKDKLGI
ncbi:MAG: chromosomal replication initiator protein DnaA [Candidatus Gracilibacteria bacterium]|nr:chromosomal replication initiator protein DnaA [Candidatus Gracilibacteria bacterium]MDD4530957.1 chromosomal replication initiator protein DnaA [Candidatus Gracilibacteria bacterium]